MNRRFLFGAVMTTKRVAIQTTNAKGTGAVVRGAGPGTTKRAPPMGKIFGYVGLGEPLEWGGMDVARL